VGWMVDFLFEMPDGNLERIRRKSPVQTRRGAEQFERQLRIELMQPKQDLERTRKEVPTLRKFSKEFIKIYARTNNKPSEIKSKESIFIIHLIPALGTKKLDQIDQQDIERYKSRKLEQGLVHKTINNHLTVLRCALSVAEEWKLIKHIPKVKWLRVPEPDFDYLEFDEADRLIEAADRDWRTMIVVALRTGMRQNEILGLRWDDVDLVRGQIHVRQGNWRGHINTPKNHRSRVIPMSRQCYDELKNYRHLKGNYVFCFEDGKPLTDGKCKWPLWSACKAAGLRRIGWKVCRHTFASHLVMRGVPLKAVQELMGHATIEMTMRYAHLSPDVRREAVFRLDEKPTAQSHGSPVAEEIGHPGNRLKLH